jgi:hypothetical protein
VEENWRILTVLDLFPPGICKPKLFN